MHYELALNILINWQSPNWNIFIYLTYILLCCCMIMKFTPKKKLIKNSIKKKLYLHYSSNRHERCIHWQNGNKFMYGCDYETVVRRRATLLFTFIAKFCVLFLWQKKKSYEFKNWTKKFFETKTQLQRSEEKKNVWIFNTYNWGSSAVVFPLGHQNTKMLIEDIFLPASLRKKAFLVELKNGSLTRNKIKYIQKWRPFALLVFNFSNWTRKSMCCLQVLQNLKTALLGVR